MVAASLYVSCVPQVLLPLSTATSSVQDTSRLPAVTTSPVLYHALVNDLVRFAFK